MTGEERRSLIRLKTATDYYLEVLGEVRPVIDGLAARTPRPPDPSGHGNGDTLMLNVHHLAFELEEVHNPGYAGTPPRIKAAVAAVLAELPTR